MGDIDTFSFTLGERTRVVLQVTEIPPSSAAGWSPCLSLLPDLVGGREIAGGCDSYHPHVDVTLEPGTYFVVVSDQNNDQTGDYEILYQPLRPADAVVPVPDTPLAGRIDSPGDYDLYAFTLTERTRVRMQVTELPPNGGGGWSPCLYLYADDRGALPPSSIVGGCDSYHPAFDQLLDAGTYYVLVLEQNNYVLGDYELLYQRVGG